MVEPIVSGRRRERVWPWFVGLIAVVAVALAFIVPLPYYLEGPGSTRDTVGKVIVTGHESFDSKGKFLYTTVSQSRATSATLLRGWLDSNIEILPEEEVNRTGDPVAERRVEQAQMDRSKLEALIVAFRVLDLPLTISGEGALIQQIDKGAPASAVLQPGDVIVAIGDKPVTTADDLRGTLAGVAPGSVVAVSVMDKTATRVVQAELMADPNDAARGILGVIPQTFNERVDTGFSIELDSGSVIGPSAGLAWTLGVIDRLTPGDLTGGRVIAITGAIDVAGNVGPIGGIEKKVVAAIRDGATLFLYPASTDEQSVKLMKEAADGKIEMRPVATIYEALAVLDPDGLGAHQPS